MLRSERQESVEILRGLAAFSVLWFHLTNGGTASFLPSGTLLKASGAYGYLGVQLFFVISGFIIPYSLSLRRYQVVIDGLGFLCRRIVRIEPAYLVSAVFVVVLQQVASAFTGSHAAMPASGLGLASSLALHFAYLAPWFNVPWLSAVYWSLAIEFQYYIAMLVFSPLLLSARRINVYTFLLATAAFPLAVHDGRHSYQLTRWADTLFPFLPLFGLGFVRFLAFRRLLNLVELSSWAVIFFGLSWFVLDHRQAFAAAFAFAFLFLPLSKPVPVLSFLGTISYSLFLIHGPIGDRVINLAVRLTPTIIVQLVAIPLAIVASIFAAYCFWRVIEKPSANLSKSIGSIRGHLTYTPATSVAEPVVEARMAASVDRGRPAWPALWTKPDFLWWEKEQVDPYPGGKHAFSVQSALSMSKSHEFRTIQLTLIRLMFYCAKEMLKSGEQTMPIYGYARVSTDGQTLAAQEAALH
jgi:peptidoglycan/LPS O-acetylase OafA/YrhL